MTEQDRREFLKKLAKSAAYSTPVIYSLATPVELAGQGKGSQHKHQKAAAFQPEQQSTTERDAPWREPPPGAQPPGGTGQPPGGAGQPPKKN